MIGSSTDLGWCRVGEARTQRKNLPRKAITPLGPRTRRRWCADPALLRDPAFPEAFEGAAILDEVQGEAGLLLWQTCRDVLLWADTPAAERQGLFAPGGLANLDRLLPAVRDVPLRRSLHQLAGLLRSSYDEALQVTDGCKAVSEWAVHAELGCTAIAFAQAAAAASPADPTVYIRAGRLLSRFRRHTAAGTWLRRAISLARKAGDKASYGHAWFELGRLNEQHDHADAARRCFLRVLRHAQRSGLRKLRARARHGLMRLAMAGDDPAVAVQQGILALREFGDDRERTGVVHDFSALMLRQDPQANAAASLQMLREIIPRRRAGADRIASLVLLVRAAGHAGAADTLEDAWFDAVRGIGRLGDSPEATRLLLDLARAGQSSPGVNASQTDDVARRALHMAARVNERALAEQADALRRELWRADPD